MSNVVDLRPSPAARVRPRAAQLDELLAQVWDLLDECSYSLNNNDGEVDLYHLTTIRRIAELLERLCETNDGQVVHVALAALSLVELARVAAEMGERSFKCSRRLAHGFVIAEALEAARDRLRTGVAANE